MCNCMLCGHNSKSNSISSFTTYNCNVCGAYTVDNDFITNKFLKYFNTPEDSFKRNEFVTKYSTYLFYNRKTFSDYKNQNRVIIGTVDSATVFNSIMGESVEYDILSDDIVFDFFPNTLKGLTEKVLSKIYLDRDLSNNTAIYSEQEAESLFCIFRDYINPKLIVPSKDAYDQVNEFLENLVDKKLIESSNPLYPYSKSISIKLTIQGREFVEKLENDITASKLEESTYHKIINTNAGNLANNSNISNSIFGNSNNVTIIETPKQSYTKQEQHDIDALQRILSDIPKYFGDQLDLYLLNHRRYKVSETRYIPYLETKINDVDNYIINPELRDLVEKLKEAFSDLNGEIAIRFCPDTKDSDLQILPRPRDNQTAALDAYYSALRDILPNAIQNAVDAYNNLCHKRTELFGI